LALSPVSPGTTKATAKAAKAAAVAAAAKAEGSSSSSSSSPDGLLTFDRSVSLGEAWGAVQRDVAKHHLAQQQALLASAAAQPGTAVAMDPAQQTALALTAAALSSPALAVRGHCDARSLQLLLRLSFFLLFLCSRVL
jgi:hypothetical protein